MKIWLKILLGVIGGFGAGFASGFFVYKKLNDVQFEEVSEEDLDKLLEGLPNETKNLSSGNTEAAEKAVFERNKAILEAGTDPDKLRNAFQGKTPYIQADDAKKQEYSKIWNTVKSYSNEANADEIPTENDNPEDEHDAEHMDAIDSEIADEVAEPEKKSEPYMITLGDFYDERREYDKITIDWYDGDDVLLDETEQPIPDPVSYVGCDMKTLFGNTVPSDGDPDCRFVRNDRYGTDYEVIRHHGSWHELSGE